MQCVWCDTPSKEHDMDRIIKLMDLYSQKHTDYLIRPADFTKVDEAIAKAEALNKDEYTDFSKVDAAVKAVKRGLDITKQKDVDAMAAAINEALAALEKKEAVTPDKPNSEKVDSPKTGDTTNTMVWLSFAAMSILASTLVLKKRKTY